MMMLIIIVPCTYRPALYGLALCQTVRRTCRLTLTILGMSLDIRRWPHANVLRWTKWCLPSWAQRLLPFLAITAYFQFKVRSLLRLSQYQSVIVVFYGCRGRTEWWSCRVTITTLPASWTASQRCIDDYTPHGTWAEVFVRLVRFEEYIYLVILSVDPIEGTD